MVLANKSLDDLTNAMKKIDEKLSSLETRQKSSDTDAVSAIMSGYSRPVGGTSDEERAMKFFGCRNPADLIQVNTAAPRFKNVPGELKQLVRDLKQTVNNARWISQQFNGDALDKIGSSPEKDRIGKCKGILSSYYGKSELAPRLKAFSSASQADWIPELISAQYVEEFELEKAVEDKFQELAIDSSPYDLPIVNGVTKARKIAENTAASEAQFGTSKLTFNAVKTVEYFILPEEVNEDSAPAIYQIGTREVVESQMRAWESAILNGDNDGTHIDSDTQAAGADVAEKICKGLRRQALLNTANGGTVSFANAAVSEAGLRSMRGAMKKFGVSPAELCWFVDPVGLQQMMALPGVATIEKYGSQATVVTGELARYQGIPIVCSQYLRSDLNATGVYDGITMNRTGILLVNMRRWWVGTRRPIRVKIQEDLPGQDRWLLASYQRKDFQGHVQSASEVSVCYGINIAV